MVAGVSQLLLEDPGAETPPVVPDPKAIFYGCAPCWPRAPGAPMLRSDPRESCELPESPRTPPAPGALSLGDVLHVALRMPGVHTPSVATTLSSCTPGPHLSDG